jgi:hypothetical protein
MQWQETLSSFALSLAFLSGSKFVTALFSQFKLFTALSLFGKSEKPPSDLAYK